ncbi:MAG TPA: dihydropteroate synthase [Candidatus Brocadiales bacterium]|nr:dihydropteroate synthase [Candidatus Brocadiales bacterium]
MTHDPKPMTFIIKHNKGSLELCKVTRIMGILNVTPDSFSDGGLFYDLDKALAHAHRMIGEGADIIDVGGESTRPGSKPVSEDEELRRVIPVIQELSKETDKPISIDTYKSRVAEKAIEAGAQIINDISGLKADREMARVAAANRAPIIINHIKGQPHNMPENPVYENLIAEVMLGLRQSIDLAVKSGINEDAIIIDPGIGFGKTTQHNLEILNRLEEFKSLERPIMVGTSRKSFIGHVLGLPLQERLIGTAATIAVAIIKGAKVVRVHDVKEAVQVVLICDAIRNS